MTKEKQNFIKHFPKTMCNISKTCKQISISRGTYYNWLDDDAEFEREVKHAKEGLIDDLESEIYMQIFEKHNIVATIFALKCLGKKRGWMEQEKIYEDHFKPLRVLDFNNPIIDEIEQESPKQGVNR